MSTFKEYMDSSDKDQEQAIADRQFNAQMEADAKTGDALSKSLTPMQVAAELARLKQLQANPGLREAEAAAKAEAEAAAAGEKGGVPGRGGRRRRHSKGHKGNSWLAHVKATMKDKKNNGKAYKQILKIAKKTYKKSQSQSGGKRRKCKTGGSTMKNYQNGGSGGKMDGVAKYATPV